MDSQLCLSEFYGEKKSVMCPGKANDPRMEFEDTAKSGVGDQPAQDLSENGVVRAVNAAVPVAINGVVHLRSPASQLRIDWN